MCNTLCWTTLTTCGKKKIWKFRPNSLCVTSLKTYVPIKIKTKSNTNTNKFCTNIFSNVTKFISRDCKSSFYPRKGMLERQISVNYSIIVKTDCCGCSTNADKADFRVLQTLFFSVYWQEKIMMVKWETQCTEE